MASRYASVKTLNNLDNRTYRTNPIYPDIPVSGEDIYIIATAEDRYDILANQFYGDPSLWWIIPIANGSSKKHSLYPVAGTQLRIPSNKEEVLEIFENFNSIR